MEGEHSMYATFGGVGPARDEGVDEQLVAIPRCYVQRSVAILIFTVDYSSFYHSG